MRIKIDFADTMGCNRCSEMVGKHGIHVVEDGSYQGTSYCPACWAIIMPILDQLAEEVSE